MVIHFLSANFTFSERQLAFSTNGATHGTMINHRARHDKREKILKSAIKVFARKGFYNAKISEIARHAGIADGTVYLYFKNKDDILISLFDESMGNIIDAFQAKLATLTGPAEKLLAFIHHHLELVRTTPDLAAVFQLELRQSNKFLKEYSGSRFNDYLNMISAIIREGQSAGVFHKNLMPGIVKRALFGALDEFSTLWVLRKDKKYDLRDAGDQIGKLFLQGLVVEHKIKPARVNKKTEDRKMKGRKIMSKYALKSTL